VEEERDAIEVVRRVERGVAALERTYTRPAEEVPRLEVWTVLCGVVEAVWRRRRTVTAEQAVGLMLRALRALGYVIEGGERGTLVVRKWGAKVGGEARFWVLLRDAYRETAPELVAPAEEYARAAYRMLFGEDETFEEVAPGWAAARASSPSPPPRPTPRPQPPRAPGTSRWGKPANAASPPRPSRSR